MQEQGSAGAGFNFDKNNSVSDIRSALTVANKGLGSE